MNDTENRIVYLSYCCPFRCGVPHDVGFVDPAVAETHILDAHHQRRAAVIKRWPHSALKYEAAGVSDVGPIR